VQETEVAPSTRLSELQEELRELKQRVAALEQCVGIKPLAQPEPPPQAALPAEAAAPSATSIIPVLGRALLGLAGAYLLRGISESALIPPLAGVLATVVYAAWWLYSVRKAARQSTLVANIHGLTAAAILYPMLWETTVRFHALPPPLTASLLALFAVAGFLIAWQGNLNGIVWITTLSSISTALALIIATRDVIPFTLALLAISAAVEWSAMKDHWTQERGTVAFAADLAVLLAVYLIAQPRGLPEGYVPYTAWQAMTLAVLLLLISLSGTIARTLFRGLSMTAVEITQMAVVVVLSVGGALRIATVTGATGIPVALVSLSAGAACYLVSFAYLDRLATRQRNFYAYSTLAIVLVTIGSMILLRGTVLALFWSAAAVSCTWLAAQANRNTVRVHGLLYLLFAGMSCGVFGNSLTRILDPPSASPPVFTLPEAVVFGGAACCYAIFVFRDHRKIASWRDGYAVFLTAGIALLPLAGFLAGAVVASMRLSFTLPIRTAMLTVFAVLLEMSGKRFRRPELVWLMYPCMVLAAYKLIARDFGEGNTVGLGVSLIFFGGALMLLPRLFRGRAAG
jgi:hypothetical protein